MAIMQLIIVTQIYQVHVGSQQWIPTQKKAHEMLWFQRSKWDRGFHRFCTDKALDLWRKSDETKKGMNCVFFNDLQAHCLKAFSGELDRSTWAKDQEKKKKRRKVDIKKAAQSSDIPFVHSWSWIGWQVFWSNHGQGSHWTASVQCLLARAEPEEFGLREGGSPFIWALQAQNQSWHGRRGQGWEYPSKEMLPFYFSSRLDQ